MLDLEEIDNTIQELENSDTTFDTCLKLASLYIVKEHSEKSVQTMVDGKSEMVENELADILPHYQKYCDVKRNWQLHNADKNHVLLEMQAVCREVQEFVEALYSNTDMPEERHNIVETLSLLYSELSG